MSVDNILLPPLSNDGDSYSGRRSRNQKKTSAEIEKPTKDFKNLKISSISPKVRYEQDLLRAYDGNAFVPIPRNPTFPIQTPAKPGRVEPLPFQSPQSIANKLKKLSSHRFSYSPSDCSIIVVGIFSTILKF